MIFSHSLTRNRGLWALAVLAWLMLVIASPSAAVAADMPMDHHQMTMAQDEEPCDHSQAQAQQSELPSPACCGGNHHLFSHGCHCPASVGAALPPQSAVMPSGVLFSTAARRPVHLQVVSQSTPPPWRPPQLIFL